MNDPAVLPVIKTHLPPGWEPTGELVDLLYSLRVGGSGPRPGVRNYNLAYANHVQVSRTLSLDEAIGALGADLRLKVAEYADGRTFVHAGVVGWQGRAIMVPGRSMAGKSTLIAALVRAGATYYSDEYAVLDADGLVHPYPRALSMRSPDARSAELLTPEDLGGRAGTGPLPVGLVVATRYAAGKRWRPRELGPARGVLELLANTIPARRAPQIVMPTLTRVVSGARVVTGPRGEADATARLILEATAQG